jgi:SAM-dependent methyltransferase
MSESGDKQAMWDDRYRTRGYEWGIEPNQFVEAHLAGLSPRRVLDLGSGQGRNAVWLAGQGHTVTAVDLSAVAAEQGRLLAEQAGVNVDFVTADATTWLPSAGTFDLVVLCYLQLPGEARRTAHRTAVTALASGGMVFLIAHHLDNLERGYGGPQSADALFTEEQLAGDFASLDIERHEQVSRPVVVDGEQHSAIDVLLIARKPV